jgi:uncharacterized protein
MVQDRLSNARSRLFEVRGKRPRPHLDDKILTSWNGLMISACAKAYQVLREASYLDRGLKAARFIRNHMYNEAKGILVRSYRGTASIVAGFLEDYAFLIQGK